MPKILEDPVKRLIAETRRQIREQGYRATTIRSVAKGCGVGVGTVYNYFDSKEQLTAAFLAEEWLLLKAEMEQKTAGCTESERVLRIVYDGLTAFLEQNRTLFSEDAARSLYAASVLTRHPMLREQLAAMLLPLASAADTTDAAFLAEFTAEALLTWTVANKSFSDLFSVLYPIIKPKENPHEQF